MAGMALLANPGEFKVKDIDPEATVAAFDRYIRRIEEGFLLMILIISTGVN